MIILIIIFMILYILIQKIKIRSLKLDAEIKDCQIKEIRTHFEIYRNVSNCESGEMGNLRKQNAELLMENMRLKSIVSTYQNTFANGFNRVRYAHQIPQDTIEAVKYAMKHAHPDNGGNEEDFIKFKKCYEKLTRK